MQGTEIQTTKGIQQRHWSRQTQPIAPADILVNRLQCGWLLDPIVKVEVHPYGPGRKLNIYHFTLVRNGETLELPVGSNPVVQRLIRERKLKIISME